MHNHFCKLSCDLLERLFPVGVLCFLLLPTEIYAQESPEGIDTGRPNIVLILTDDQGYGDLGFHKNPVIQTPNLDRFARESRQLESFYVSPVCAPTRASLMTGRYNYRTGVVDTYLGRAMMHPEETTLAEVLADAGYQTGIFGKWHLGDNYPMRAQDQGFRETLIHKGGGIGQPADPPGNTYQDPVLFNNGNAVQMDGYCSDLFTNAAIDFIQTNRKESFFAYLSFNCPHTPLEVSEDLVKPYRVKLQSEHSFPVLGHPLESAPDLETTSRVYAMLENIDTNIGHLLKALEEMDLEENTLVVFLSDNGPQQVRYNRGLFQRKGSVYEGGIRVPCFARWPLRIPADTQLKTIAAHIDWMPTILDACRVDVPENLQLDGKSLMGLLEGKSNPDEWPDRTLFFQWHRGDEPVLYRAFAARSQNYKLVQPLGVRGGDLPENPSKKLYNIVSDPYEQYDVASASPEIVRKLEKEYEEWFLDVSGSRGYAPPRIHLGDSNENPVTLTRQDWRGPRAGRGKESLGHWEVHVAESGNYRITLKFSPTGYAGIADFSLRGNQVNVPLAPQQNSIVFSNVSLTVGQGRLEASILTKSGTRGVQFVEIEKLP